VGAIFRTTPSSGWANHCVVGNWADKLNHYVARQKSLASTPTLQLGCASNDGIGTIRMDSIPRHKSLFGSVSR